MIAIRTLGLAACARVFKLLFKLMGKGFDSLEEAVLGNGRRKTRCTWLDDDDDD